jgi:hypothetical protein
MLARGARLSAMAAAAGGSSVVVIRADTGTLIYYACVRADSHLPARMLRCARALPVAPARQLSPASRCCRRRRRVRAAERVPQDAEQEAAAWAGRPPGCHGKVRDVHVLPQGSPAAAHVHAAPHCGWPARSRRPPSTQAHCAGRDSCAAARVHCRRVHQDCGEAPFDGLSNREAAGGATVLGPHEREPQASAARPGCCSDYHRAALARPRPTPGRQRLSSATGPQTACAGSQVCAGRF